MSHSTLASVLFITVCAFCTLYLPQPLLPLLAAEYAVSVTDASLLISATLVPLAIAPLFYGYITEAVSAKRVLRIALAALAINQAAFLIADSYWSLVGLRFVQGLLLPAIFTALMTYSANMAHADKVRNAVSYYIAATILGGFMGRLAGGVAGQFLHWRWGFAVFAVLLALSWLIAARLPSDARPANPVAPLGAGAFAIVLRWPGYFAGLAGLLLVFSVYASLLTLLPFRLKQLDPAISELIIALMYLGYLSGIVVAVLGPRLGAWLKSDLAGILLGAVVIVAGIGTMLVADPLAVFLAMVLLSGGFFLVHAMLSAYLNHAAPHSKGLVNGLYLAFYYTGGALGAYLPGFVFGAFGWRVYLLALSAIFVAGVATLLGLRRVRG